MQETGTPADTTPGRRKSRFILFWGILFLPLSAGLFLLSIPPNLALYQLYRDGIMDGATVPAYNRLEVLFYGNLPFFSGLFSLLCLLWLLASIGLLRRRRWSRTVLNTVFGIFILAMAAVLVSLIRYDYEITAWRDPERNLRAARWAPWILAGGIAALSGFLYMLNTSAITRHLRGSRILF